MTRLIISLEDEHRAWLEKTAAEMGVSMAEVARMAIDTLRTSERESKSKRLQQLLEQTHGTWTQGDGLEYQRKMREEWD